MADLRVQYGGLEFKNPVIAVSGPLGRTYQALKKSIEAGVSAVTLKSCNAKPPPDLSPKPGSHVYPKPAHMFLKKYGLPKVMINWEGVPADFSAEMEAELIERIKPLAREHDVRIIANMHPDPMYMEDQEMFRDDLRILMEAEPDLIELCPCPYHFPPEMTSPDRIAINAPTYSQVMGQIYDIAMEEVDIPVITKSIGLIFVNTYEDLKEHNISCLHVAEGPLFYGTVVDIETMKPIAPGPAVMIYGTLRRPILNLMTARTKALGDVELISAGGVWDARDCVERMMCGATLVGMHTAIQYHGHKRYGEVIDGLSDFLDKKGLTPADITGAAVNEILSDEAHEAFMREHDITDEEIKPVIDMDKCNGCKLCANCIHAGIEMEGDMPVLHLENCVRCGICESVCPVEAITLERVKEVVK
jgi:dihydropyrimidine dehydrogenase (NAD+) subunit PreA